MVDSARRVVKARKSRAPGRVVRIDLGDGHCAYGRQLLGPTVEFYLRQGVVGETVDLLDLVESQVAFTVWVMDYAFKRNGAWDLLDVVELTDEEEKRVHRWAKKDRISGALSIYWSDRWSGTRGEEPASREDLEGLEVAAVWDPEHIEDRLRDHFAGRPNKWVELLRF